MVPASMRRSWQSGWETRRWSITLDRYSHVLPGLQEAAVKAFDVEFDAATPEYGVLDFRRDTS